ncbi:prephenate dehydrogenase [Petroclostridium xylanilyticum]|jgi:prephenate dehydrogenase|uniref:prephenate dehydrogenase n=1 Tax=Petroclostridium xylanilyticum TaxID=1792311 RepID=UPI000B98A9E0|nr:prephenate dehydrogenase [Petroclostridium xylanilyticum]
MNVKCVAIIGLGLIGGSIAKALKERSGIKNIIGIDFNQDTLTQALNEGIISLGSKDIVPEIYNSDIVFICTPVSKTLEWIKKVIPAVRPDCIITDVGSTKSQLVSEIEQIPGEFHFVGGHPMAGSERSGFSASKSHLFENAYYILTPCSKSTQEDIEILINVVKNLGSIPVELSPQLHDKVTGAISHVPHIISAALVNIVKNSDTDGQYMQKLAAGGFKDITRISSSNPEMWHNICFSNKDAIIQILDNYIVMLSKFKLFLESRNDNEVYNFFSSAKEFRDSLASRVTSLIPGTYELIIDVVDKPGIIGEVATILGKNNINIKNINVNNNREFEGGVLIISLPDIQSLQKADEILTGHGYRVVHRK